MPINLEMPKLSDTMTEGTLVTWRVKVGDEIEIGDVIADIETDKATMEMEAFDEGTIASILVQEGQKVPVGTVLGVIAEDGEDISDAGAASSPAPPTTEAPSAETAAEPTAAAAPEAVASAVGDGRVRISPYARKLAAKKGIDVAQVKGTGPNGRVIAADIESFDPAQAASAAPLAAASTSSAPAAVAILPVFDGEDKEVPLSSMRKIIADRLLTSKVTIPHFYLHVEVDAQPMINVRKQINEQSEKTHGNKFTFNDFVVKAMINACQSVPEVNASYAGDKIIQFANVGVSVAIAVEDGLVTPVVKQAQDKSLLAISKEIKGMAQRARDKKLAPNEFDGGTITISNLGAWGIESFDAIVNPPQAAIVSVGGIIDKAVVENGEIVPGKRMNLGLSCDHRVVDGAVAATFLNEVKKLLENPSLMLI